MKDKSKKEKFENISTQEQIKRNNRKANIVSNIAIYISVMAIILNIIAYLDELVSFVYYVLSYQH